MNECLDNLLYLTEIGTFFWDGEISSFIGTAEESRMVEKIGLSVIRFPLAKADPEKVNRLFTFIKYLKAESLLQRTNSLVENTTIGQPHCL